MYFPYLYGGGAGGGAGTLFASMGSTVKAPGAK